MNRRYSRIVPTVVVFATLVALSTSLLCAQKPVASYKDLKYPPLHDVKTPQPERITLPNGITIFLLEDHELPMVSVAARIRTGNRLESEDKAGIASIVGEVMRSGGTTSVKGDDLDIQLDRIGASVESGIEESEGSAFASSLKENAPQVIHILADILRNPAFPQDKIDLMKTQLIDGISRRNEDKDAIASREFRRILYGKDSAYGAQPEYATVDSITRADVVAFHKRYYQPENVILGVWGDFDKTAMRALLEKEFGSWPKGGNPKPPVPPVEEGAKTRSGVYVIDKTDVNQSTIIIGALGDKRIDPDYVASTVATRVLGGGFSSRLFNRVRTQEALAYSAGAGWSAGFDMPGEYTASASTKSGSTVKALNVIKEEIHKMGETPVSDAELQQAKDAVLKGIAFDNDSTGKIVTRLIQYEYFGYPADWLKQYQDGVRNVTKADVQRVSKQYWDSNKMFVLIVGNTKEFDEPVSSLGPVTNWNIDIPKPAAAAAPAATEATPDSLAQGKELLAKARAAAGGDKLAGVHDFVQSGSMSVETPQGAFALTLEATTTSGGKTLQKIGTPGGEILQAYDGKSSWAKTPQGIQEVPGGGDEAADDLFRETIFLLAKSPGYSAQNLGPAQFGDKQAVALLVTDPATKRQVKLFVDPATNLIIGKEYTGKGPSGRPGEMKETYSDFKDVDGLKLPAKTLVTENGKKAAEITVSKTILNTGVADSAFAKP